MDNFFGTVAVHFGGVPPYSTNFFSKSVNYLRTSSRPLKDDRKKTDPIGPLVVR